MDNIYGLQSEAELINITRPKYSEMDMQKIKNEYEETIDKLKTEVEVLKDNGTLVQDGINFAAIMIPQFNPCEFEVSIAIRDANFTITNVKLNEGRIFIDIKPNDAVSLANMRKAEKCY